MRGRKRMWGGGSLGGDRIKGLIGGDCRKAGIREIGKWERIPIGGKRRR